ncbi:hypothetical protein GQ472_05750 [archaeon]|nr:hypothetical protein [archaeon]
MDLKEYLEKTIEYQRIELEEAIQNNVDASANLGNTDMDSAVYHVFLRSLWPEGEKNIDLTDEGSLEYVIRTAEEDFKKINNRSDVQADYVVSIVLDDLEYVVPKEYWVQ